MPVRLRTRWASRRPTPGARASKGWRAEGTAATAQRRRAALRSTGGRGRSTRPWVCPALAAKSNLRVARNEGAVTAPTAAQTAPDFSVSSKAHKVSVSRALTTRTRRSCGKPRSAQPQPKGWPCSVSQARSAMKARGRRSSVRRALSIARAKAKAVAAGKSCAAAGATSSNGSGAGKASPKLSACGASRRVAGTVPRVMFPICSHRWWRVKRAPRRSGCDALPWRLHRPRRGVGPEFPNAGHARQSQASTHVRPLRR